MKWEALRRETGLVEVLCEHGVGHPLPASIKWMDEHGPIGARGTWGIHGCCGCCGREDFPQGGDENPVPWIGEAA